MAEGDEFAALTKLLDEAVLDPRLWVAVCDRLAAFLGGVGTVLVAEEPDKQGPWVVRSKSLDGLIDAVFRDGWQHRNFRRRSVPLMKRRGYATDYDIADAATMRREPFYTELLAPQKLGTFIGLGIPIGPDFHVAAIEREIGAPAPDADLIGRIERIQPVLMAAGRTSAALGRMKLDIWRDLSSDPERAIFLIDHFGRVIERNAAAEDFVGPSLHLKQQQIRLTDGAANVRFQHLIAAATAHGSSDPLPPPIFSGLTEGKPIIVEVMRLPLPLRDFHTAAAAMVIIRRIGSTEHALPELLRRVASLTEAEVRVAMALFEGQSLQDYARRVHLTVGTVRQQLKAAFRKTGTGRQAELLTWMRRLEARDAS